MRQRDETRKDSAGKTVRDIRRATRRRFASEEKIRIVLEGLRGEDSIAELCRKEGIIHHQVPAIPLICPIGADVRHIHEVENF